MKETEPQTAAAPDKSQLDHIFDYYVRLAPSRIIKCSRSTLVAKLKAEHAAHESLAKYIEDEVLPMLEMCGYGGKNRVREDSHIKQMKKRLAAIRGEKAVQS